MWLPEILGRQGRWSERTIGSDMIRTVNEATQTLTVRNLAL